MLQLLQTATGPRTPIRVHTLAAGAHEVMGGGEDLPVAAPFADNLVITSLSGRCLQRARGRHGTGLVCKSHVLIGTRSSGNEPRAQEPVRNLDDRAVSASLSIGLNFNSIAHFHSVQQTMVIIRELVCACVACRLQNLVRCINADAIGTEKTAARCDSAKRKRDALLVNIMIGTGAGGIRQRPTPVSRRRLGRATLLPAALATLGVVRFMPGFQLLHEIKANLIKAW